MPLRIAQVAPLVETVPPEAYGGTERIVSYLTEELVRLGQDVTLFASGGSATAAKLVPISERSVRSDPDVKDPLTRTIVEIEEVLKRTEDCYVVAIRLPLSLEIRALPGGVFRDSATELAREAWFGTNRTPWLEAIRSTSRPVIEEIEHK